jgi:nicotinamide-nucleotide amidase
LDLELITIGTELLLGFTVDTNSAELAQILASHGIRVARRTSVPDQAHDIRDAVLEALQRTKTVITVGGLGPTKDDITKEAVARLFEAPLAFDQAVWDDIVTRYRRLGRTPAGSNRSQAMIPRGATVLPNRWGTAPGLWLEGPSGEGRVVMLPGVPYEMRKLAEREVGPRLARLVHTPAPIVSHVLRTAGIAESTLADRLGDVNEAIHPITLAYLPQTAGVDVRLTSWDVPIEEAQRRLDRAAQEIRRRAGAHCYGEGTTDLAAVVIERLVRAGVDLAVAESCTGGLLAGRLTSIPGSSAAFMGGVIAYHNRVKIHALGVAEEVIATHGAVSEAVALAMVRGVQRRFGVGAALSVTGIAGPEGGSEEKPVGTVWVGIAVREEAIALHRVYHGTRWQVRERAVAGALYELLARLPS